MGVVSHSIEANIATIVLSNEGRFNAMSLSMWQELAILLKTLKADQEVRAVILRGQGDRAFVSGADISEFKEQRNDPAGVANYDRAVDEAQSALSAFPKPIIAAISGICYGGGLGLMLACDLRYGSADAKFRMPAARLGLGYGLKNVKRMVDVVGAAHASEMLYTAQVYSAKDAVRINLLNAIADDVFDHAQQIALLIASNAPLTIAAGKLAMNTILSGQDQARAPEVARAVQACFESSDYAEGRLAFAEKRPARFTGH